MKHCGPGEELGVRIIRQTNKNKDRRKIAFIY